MAFLGIWAMASPWVLGFSSISIAKWNSLITGLVVVLFNVWIIFGDTADMEVGSGEPKKGRIDSKTKA